MENDKWGRFVSGEDNVRLGFSGMVGGAMDYRGGGMMKLDEKDDKVWFKLGGCVGSGWDEVGMYVVYESGVEMVGDCGWKYYGEEKWMDLLSEVGVVWDERGVLKGCVGE